MKKIIVTGSNGLIGSQVSEYFHNLGWKVYGIDNNQRAIFFGTSGDTRWRQEELQLTLKNFIHNEIDIRDRKKILNIIKEIKPDAIVHAAAQPSHDKAASIPFDDFEVNAGGTLNLLEGVRQFVKESPFIYMSTNKVYGDNPNKIPMIELDKRWDYKNKNYKNGISESFNVDQCTHSVFGADKLAADVLVQEYGKYFNMKTCCLRGGCLTGRFHSGVELHGFLSYLIKCNVEDKVYKIYGYKGKQVRDNIHSLDVARFIEEFINNPRQSEVYNIGGGKSNSCSIIEASEVIESFSNKKMKFEYSNINRIGDHICYYSDLTKMKNHYPNWDITISLNQIILEILNKGKTK